MQFLANEKYAYLLTFDFFSGFNLKCFRALRKWVSCTTLLHQIVSTFAEYRSNFLSQFEEKRVTWVALLLRKNTGVKYFEIE